MKQENNILLFPGGSKVFDIEEAKKVLPLPYVQNFELLINHTNQQTLALVEKDSRIQDLEAQLTCSQTEQVKSFEAKIKELNAEIAELKKCTVSEQDRLDLVKMSKYRQAIDSIGS